jgi:hypothetical protein
MKLATEKVLNAMNLRGDVAWRKARNLSNRRRVHPFEVQEHDLLVGRLEFPNQRPDVIECRLVDLFTLVMKARFDLFEVHKGRSPHLLPDDHGRGCVVSDPVNPSSQRASTFEVFEALPDSDMNFLEKISTLIRIRFISAGNAVESSAITGHCFFVEVIPRGPDICHPLT